MTWPADLASLPSALTDPAAGASGWIALLLLGLVMIVPFGPSEAAAVTAGTLAHAGVVAPGAAAVSVAIGMLLGDFLIFSAAGPLLDRVRSRWSQRPHVAAMLSGLVTKPSWRDAGLAGLRFVPGARTPAALLARELQTSRARFLGVAGAGSLVWAGLWTSGGFVLAHGLLNR